MPRVSVPPLSSAGNRLSKFSSNNKAKTNFADDNFFDFSSSTSGGVTNENEINAGNSSSSTIKIQKPHHRRLCKASTNNNNNNKVITTATEQLKVGDKHKSETKIAGTKTDEVAGHRSTKVEKTCQSTSSSSTNCSSIISSSNSHRSTSSRAIAVDTRVLLHHNASFEGEAGIRLFLHETYEFLKLCARRGYLPLYYANCGPPEHLELHDDNRSDTIVLCRASTLPLELLTGWSNPHSPSAEQEAWNDLFVPVTVKSFIKETPESVNISSAQDSWHLFVEFVTTIVHEAYYNKSSMKPPSPLDVSILISDIALFSEDSSERHSSGLQHFWNGVRNFFVNGNVRSITIVIVETGATSVVGTISQAAPAAYSSSTSKLAIAQSLCNLRNCLDTLHEDDSHNLKKGKCPMQIALEVIGCNFIEYGSILRRWIQKDLLLQARRSNTIEIELPEDALDGSSCSIRLDLSFKAIPFPLNIMLQLYPSDEKMQVIQVVPNDAVDASLIYGVAMAAEPAIDSDYNTFKEMRSLVTQIVKWLTTNDASLVLRGISDKGAGFAQCNNYFLLTAETQHNFTNQATATNKSGYFSNCRACLFRYAASEQILDVGDSTNRISSNEYSNDDNDQQKQIDQQYYDYVDKSLQLLDKTALNPLLLPGLSYHQQSHNYASSFSQSQQPSTSTFKDHTSDSYSTSGAPISTESMAIQGEQCLAVITTNQTSLANPFSKYSFADFDEDIPCNYAFDDT